jgi:Na+/citrate or Na+/malate symporter
LQEIATEFHRSVYCSALVINSVSSFFLSFLGAYLSKIWSFRVEFCGHGLVRRREEEEEEEEEEEHDDDEFE